MLRSTSGKLVILIALITLSGCAGLFTPEAPLEFTPQTFPTGQYAPKVDNFQVILDASESMDPAVYYHQRYPTARNFVDSLNQSIPTDLNYQGGLRTFGHSAAQSSELTALVYGMTSYNRSGFDTGLNSIKSLGGNSPLSNALIAAGKNLASAKGKSAIVVVSDGVNMASAPAAAKKIKADMGDNLCIYTVWVGDNMEGKPLLESVAKAGGCGYATTATALTDSARFSQFVQDVFLASKKPMAKAPPPPPRDSDGDGVTDDRDKCPDTLPGVMVDEDGCDLKYTLQIEFDFDKADIRAEYHDNIAKAAAFVKKNPNTKVLVAGHTDSRGDADYNKQLSMRRAEALKAYMVKNFGIDAGQLYPRGYGEARPVATNDTDGGRQQNRRVEFICCAIIPPE